MTTALATPAAPTPALRSDDDHRGVRLAVVEASDPRGPIDAMARGEPETYGFQHYSLSYVLRTAEQTARATTIATMTEAFEDRRGALDLIGLSYWGKGGPARLDAALAAADPTHIVLRTPLARVAAWAKRRGVALLPMFADSFAVSGWSPRAVRQRLRHAALARALRGDHVTLACNHNRAASRDLVRIGVPKDIVLPWEWPMGEQTETEPPRTLPRDRPFRLLYVGALVRAKGVLDLVSAFGTDAWLRENARLTLIGGGDTQDVQQAIDAAGLGETVILTGRVPSERVATEMRRADLVFVPSHYAYAEGLPKTIREALTARTPLVLTDHPMFRGYFDDSPAATFVPEREPAALARAARAVLTDDDRYADASRATSSALAALNWPHAWADVIDQWLRGDPGGELARHRGDWS